MRVPRAATPLPRLGMIKKIESYPELADPQLQPRYSGIPTFFRLPHSVRLDELDIGLVGVPFDGGVTNRPGARHGPRDIRNQSSLIRKINQATGVAPFDLVWAATASDIEGPTDLDWVSLCFETEISRCALDSCMAQKRSNCLQIASAFQNVESLRPA